MHRPWNAHTRSVLPALIFATMFAPFWAHADDDEQPTEIDAVPIYALRSEEFGLNAVESLAEWFKGSLFTKASLPPLPVEQVLEDQDLGGCDELRGNPVRLPSGQKVEHETDFASDGEMGLFLTRTYGGHDGRLFGSRWRTNFEYSLEWDEYGRGIKAIRPDGSVIWLPVASGEWRQSPDKPLPRIQQSYDGSLTLFNEAGGTEVYDRDGRIQVVRNAHGIGWHYTYADGRLQRVAHTSGRAVQFGWTNNELTQVTDPAGSIYRYSYRRIGLNARLASTTLAGAPTTTITYDYLPSPYEGHALGNLAGKSFEGVRYSTFVYESTNASARVASTEHAGGVDNHAFTYHGDLGSKTKAFTVGETNPLGHKTSRQYLDGRLISVDDGPSAYCARRFRELHYDANGQPERATGFAGATTTFEHDAAGRLVRKVEGAGTASPRTRTYAWAPDRNRVMSKTLLGIDETIFTYAGNGRIASETIKDLASGATRKTTYAYTTHASGMLASMTVTGPQAGDARTFIYSATGDLVEARDGAGGVTKYSGHNGRGQPARIAGPTGAVNEFEYDARGRVVVERSFPSGTPVQKRYVYGASGLLDAMQTDGGNTVVRHYDAARRLIQEDVTEPGGTFSVRRISYDAMSQPIKVEIGRD